MPYNKERLLKLKEKYAGADRKLGTLRGPGTPDVETVYEHLRDYLMVRLLLSEKEMVSDDLKTIIEINLKKQEEMLKAGVRLEDVLAPGCAGLTGAKAKKIYLFLTIQSILGIKMNEKQTPYIETIRDLAETVTGLLRR